MKTEACQNSEQNAIVNSAIDPKKVYRRPFEIACKIIAFQEIAKADSTKSARDIAKILDVPNTSMQTWRRQGSLQDSHEDEISAFLSTVAGQTHLARILNASMYNKNALHRC